MGKFVKLKTVAECFDALEKLSHHPDILAGNDERRIIDVLGKHFKKSKKMDDVVNIDSVYL